METYISNDSNNPINWNGTNPKCNFCGEDLDSNFDYEEICNDCFNADQDEDDEVAPIIRAIFNLGKNKNNK
tara:strand:+ start:625 stop:837 length:213 start_codon:yes stop_codon:yes gene_type:complete